MEPSPWITRANRLLTDAGKTPLSQEAREEQVIELASFILKDATHIMSPKEADRAKKMAAALKDPHGKAFLSLIADQIFRSNDPQRVLSQLLYIMDCTEIPNFLAKKVQLKLKLLKTCKRFFPKFSIQYLVKSIRKESAHFILPGEADVLSQHLLKRKKEALSVNVKRLSETILGDEEARRQLRSCLDDLANPEIEAISIKISNIFSQINLISCDDTVKILKEKLRLIYYVALHNTYSDITGKECPKLVYLDIEEYRYFSLTIDVFQKVLNEPDFLTLKVGIILQSYLPESFPILKKLTDWANNRINKGGAPIQIRIVKGGNLAMERVEASLEGWPQACYKNKLEVDANFKKMLHFAFLSQHAKAVHIGIATHNLFDIAYALILRSENKVEPYVTFEMLEGLAAPIRRSIQQIVVHLLLYCPIAKSEDFHYAIAYLIRLVDENFQKESFIHYSYDITPKSNSFRDQKKLFMQSCDQIPNIAEQPRRTQNRSKPIKENNTPSSFINEPNTDWTLAHNRKWAEKIIKEWYDKKHDLIPLVIDNQEIITEQRKIGKDPSRPSKTLYEYACAQEEHIEKALHAAEQARKNWSDTSIEERCQMIKTFASLMRKRRAEFIGVMMADVGKIITEGDMEVSAAIDYAEYYSYSIEELYELSDLSYKAKGSVLVLPAWSTPADTAASGIISALLTGNTVILKPSSEALLVHWHLINVFWDAGIPKDVLQFLPCSNDPLGNQMIQDPRISCILLSGSNETAKHFIKLRPNVNLLAETSGKNAIIISGLCDLDLAIKDIIESAFNYSGQKSSAAGLVICDSDIYDNPLFVKQLLDATKSLKVGSAWDLNTQIGPLIRRPNLALKRGLYSLARGEIWMLEPKADENNPLLWHPGIKFGVKEKSHSHEIEFFGPILSVMRSKNLKQAIQFVNGTKQSITSGLHSLDEREFPIWLNKIDSGNLYINRKITHAVVGKQPYGGCKVSVFGFGNKTGGPHYLQNLMHIEQKKLPHDQIDVFEKFERLGTFFNLTPEDLELYEASISSYTYWYQKFQEKRDYFKLIGQDNYTIYKPLMGVVLRIHETDSILNILRVCAACQICRTPLQVSWDKSRHPIQDLAKLSTHYDNLSLTSESETEFLMIVRKNKFKRIRLLASPNKKLCGYAALPAVHIDNAPVLANGRMELLHYLREVSVSYNYHRYGCLGIRGSEERSDTL